VVHELHAIALFVCAGSGSLDALHSAIAPQTGKGSTLSMQPVILVLARERR
jgi:hypothetical protein